MRRLALRLHALRLALQYRSLGLNRPPEAPLYDAIRPCDDYLLLHGVRFLCFLRKGRLA